MNALQYLQSHYSDELLESTQPAATPTVASANGRMATYIAPLTLEPAASTGADLDLCSGAALVDHALAYASAEGMA